jgi:hypothetical protein
MLAKYSLRLESGDSKKKVDALSHDFKNALDKIPRK